jgi:hypothetical protein
VTGQRHAPTTLYPEEKTQYPIYRRLGGPQGRFGQVRKILPPPEFVNQNVFPPKKDGLKYKNIIIVEFFNLWPIAL